MNFVPRTSLKWALESHGEGSEEIKYEIGKKIQRNERGSDSICTISEMNLVYSHPSTPLD